tara:strand:+ start:509 stop:916 length:408 start_codon:yes stop_codon:yes gene_type:complete
MGFNLPILMMADTTQTRRTKMDEIFKALYHIKRIAEMVNSNKNLSPFHKAVINLGWELIVNTVDMKTGENGMMSEQAFDSLNNAYLSILASSDILSECDPFKADFSRTYAEDWAVQLTNEIYFANHETRNLWRVR